MGADPMVPDLAAADKAVRKRRAPKHDFKDGFGKVFAHRHDNGGGWVADTAYVAPSVKVTRNAQVFGYAKVYDSCEIMGSSRVYGRAKLFDTVSLTQRATINGNAVVFGTAKLEDSAIIGGQAQVSGSTRLLHRARVLGNAKVFNTYASGPVVRGELTITDSAIVENGRVYGYTAIFGNSFISDSTVQNSVVGLAAHIISSTVSSDFGWQQSSFLNRIDGITSEYVGRAEQDVLISLSRGRMMIHGTLINSTLTSSRLTLPSTVTMIGSRIMLRYSHEENRVNAAVEFFNALGDQQLVFLNLQNANYVEDLQRHLAAGGGDRPPVNIPGYVPPSTGQSPPNLEIIRQRRLMRLEGDSP